MKDGKVRRQTERAMVRAIEEGKKKRRNKGRDGCKKEWRVYIAGMYPSRGTVNREDTNISKTG